jgi:phage tail-like protein
MADAPNPNNAQNQQNAATARLDPLRGYNYKLDAGPDLQGSFTEVSGLEIRVPAIRYREAGEKQIVRALPSRPEYGEITLRYGLTTSKALFDWFMKGVTDGAADPKHVHIIMLANDGATELTRWSLDNAWPTCWRGAALDAMGHEVAIESLTLVFERLERT